jgi:hypothetical protein
MMRPAIIRIIRIVLILITLIFTESVMSESEGLVFSVNGSGGNYTNTDVRIKGNHFTMAMRGNSRAEGDMPGIGIFEGTIDKPALDGLRHVVATMRDERGYVDFYQSLKYLQGFYDTGLRTVKLDIKPTILPKAGGFLVTLAFQNSGKEAIAFSSPSVWEGRYNPMAGSSWAVVSAVREDNIKLHNESLEFDTGFIGSPALVNKGDFQNEVLHLQPGETRYAQYMVFPSNPFKKGRYLIAVSVAIRQVSEPMALNGYAEFTGQKTYAEFVHDYPTTTEEVAAFDAHRRAANQ